MSLAALVSLAALSSLASLALLARPERNKYVTNALPLLISSLESAIYPHSQKTMSRRPSQPPPLTSRDLQEKVFRH